MRVGGETQVLCSVLGDCFSQQVAPGVIGVAVAPVFGLVLQDFCVAIGPGVLGGSHAVQPVIGEGLVAVGVFVISDAEDVPVVAVAFVKVIVNQRFGFRLTGDPCRDHRPLL